MSITMHLNNNDPFYEEYSTDEDDQFYLKSHQAQHMNERSIHLKTQKRENPRRKTTKDTKRPLPVLVLVVSTYMIVLISCTFISNSPTNQTDSLNQTSMNNQPVKDTINQIQACLNRRDDCANVKDTPLRVKEFESLSNEINIDSQPSNITHIHERTQYKSSKRLESVFTNDKDRRYRKRVLDLDNYEFNDIAFQNMNTSYIDIELRILDHSNMNAPVYNTNKSETMERELKKNHIIDIRNQRIKECQEVVNKIWDVLERVLDRVKREKNSKEHKMGCIKLLNESYQWWKNRKGALSIEDAEDWYNRIVFVEREINTYI